MLKINTDILIIGGGIAGCTAAISLVNHFNVTLIDKLEEPIDKIGESLAPASQRILKKIGLFSEFNEQINLYKNSFGLQSYWGSDQLHIVDHLKNPDGLVKSLNRKKFEHFLRTSALKRGVNCHWGTKLYSNSFKKNKWYINAVSNTNKLIIETSFIIDATGRQSNFAKSLGIKRKSIDKLIASWITLPNFKENTMGLISAAENGWWYSAVVPNNKRVIAFHTDADLIDKSQLKSKNYFLKLAEKNKEIFSLLFNKQKEAIAWKGTVAANSTKLTQVSGNKWIALGDAAISFDPLSSQGMFNAMANAMQITDLILQFGLTEKLSQVYSYQIHQIWSCYIKHKHTFYQSEKRWNSSDFWKRRNSI